jgi:hypothetical protein
MVLDIEKFHHTCPILPAHKKMFLLKGPKGFCIKHNAPFSCSSSSSSVGIIANAGVDIWSAEGVDPTEKYEDDMSNFRYPIPSRKPAPYSYTYNRTEALWRITCLRIPWHPIKFHDYAFIFTFLGFLWNLTDRTITLPEAKRKKFLTCTVVPQNPQVAALLDDRCHEAPRLALSSRVRLPGRAHLPPLVVQLRRVLW